MTDTVFNAGTTITNQTFTIDAGDRLIFGPSARALIADSTTITADGTFINEGSMVSANVPPDFTPGSLEIDGAFVNYGTITDLGALTIAGPFTNLGTITGTRVFLETNTTTDGLAAEVARINPNVGLFFSGTLDNTGQTLSFQDPVMASVQYGGTIVGGTLLGSFSGSPPPLSGTLDGVTIASLGLTLGTSVTVINGLTFPSFREGSITLTGSSGLSFVGTQDLGLGGVISFAGFSLPNALGDGGGLGGDHLTITDSNQLVVQGDGLLSGGTIINDGVINAVGTANLQPGTLEVASQDLQNDSEISLSNAVLDLAGSTGGGSFENAGAIELANGSTIDVTLANPALGLVDFEDGSTQSIRDEITSPGAQAPLTGTLQGFDVGASIVFPNLMYTDGDSVNYSDGVLTISDDGVTIGQLTIEGTHAAGDFHIGEALPGGFGIAVVPCYCRGTAILTPAGEVAVEALRIGDLVTTYAGQDRPVKWIGRHRW
jgi:hypothetical protein